MNNKMCMNKKMRGFTIVELVIVIAVIAILAAVAIPTFASVIRKAQISAKTQNAQNINKILAVDELTDGAPTTMHGVINELLENGVGVEEFDDEGDLILVWNQLDNRVVVLDDELNAVYTYDGEDLPSDKSLIWTVADELPDEQVTSIYLCDDFDESNVVVSAGLDVGNNEDIVGITFNDTDEDNRNITLRSNGSGTAVNVNNRSDSVDMLGLAKSVSTQSSETNQLNYLSIYATLEKLELNSGNVIAKANSSIDTIQIFVAKKDDMEIEATDKGISITGENFTLLIENGAIVGKVLDKNGDDCLMADGDNSENVGEEPENPDTPNLPGGETGEGSDEGGENTEGADEPNIDPYYGFEVFDTSGLDTTTGEEAYLVDYETDDESQKYMSLEKALEYASTNGDEWGYIVLLKNETEDECSNAQYSITISKNIVLDLNGHKLENCESDYSKIIIKNGGHLQVIDTSESGGGEISASCAKNGIEVEKDSRLTVYNGKISGIMSAIYMKEGAVVTIKDGVFENIGSGNTIVLAGASELNISGGTFSIKDATKKWIYVNDSTEKSIITIEGIEFSKDKITSGEHYTLIIK